MSYAHLTQEELAAVIAAMELVSDRKGPLRSAHSKLVTDYRKRKVAETIRLKGELAPITTRPRTSFARYR